MILRLGSDEEILALKDPQTRLIDLQGRLMLPGFADTHLHLLFYGTFRRRIDLVNTTTYEEVVRMCREGAEKVRGTNRWVIGCNFNQINWTDTNKIPRPQRSGRHRLRCADLFCSGPAAISCA